MTATVIAEVQREVCGLHPEIMKPLPFGRYTPGQIGYDVSRSISGSTPVQFQLTTPLGVNIPNVLFIAQVELRLSSSEGCILRSAPPTQCFQAFLCFENVLSSHEDVQILGLPQTDVSVHFQGKKRTLQRHYGYVGVIQRFQNARKQLKVDNGLHSARIASFSHSVHDWFWYDETGNTLEGGPTERGSPMSIDETQIVSPDQALSTGLTDRFLLPGPP